VDLYNLPTAANSSRSRSKRGQLEPPTPPHIRGGRLGEGPLPQQIGCLLMRDLRDRLAEVSRMRRASTRVVRHSLAWRMRMAPVVRDRENAGHLDLLGGSCLKLTRTTPAMNAADRRRLAPSVRELAGAVADPRREARGSSDPPAGGGSRTGHRPPGRRQRPAVPSSTRSERWHSDGRHRRHGVLRCRPRAGRRRGAERPRRAPRPRPAADVPNAVPVGPLTPNSLIEASLGALQHQVDTEVAPGQGARVALGEHRDPPVVHHQRPVLGADLAVVAPVDGVVPEQVGEVVGGGDVVDRGDLEPLGVEQDLQGRAADPPSPLMATVGISDHRLCVVCSRSCRTTSTCRPCRCR
jgi:hypothetical protein